MPSNKGLTHALAASFVAGAWEIDGLTERGARLLGRRYRWLRPLAERLCRAFSPPERRTRAIRPKRAAVARFLANDAGFARACDRYELKLRDFAAAKPTMLPSAAPISSPLPALDIAGDVADWLQLTPGRLDWLADVHGRRRCRDDERLRNYHYRVLRKGRDKLRLLEVPKPTLKRIQRRILGEILDPLPPHDAAHGFRRGRSIRSFAAPHVGRRVVLRLDFGDFFPSIRAPRVHALFRTLGYAESVADLLAGLCTNVTPWQVWPSANGGESTGPPAEELRRVRRLYEERHLPQGAPTSPALANLCAFRLDARLTALAASAGATYTRYADDLAFSGDREFERGVRRFASHVSVVAAEEGFTVNHRKTRVMREGVRQHLAGLVVNRTLNVARPDFDRLKAVLTNSVRHGPATQNRDARPDFRAHLLGHVSYVEAIHAARGRKLRELFDRINW